MWRYGEDRVTVGEVEAKLPALPEVEGHPGWSSQACEATFLRRLRVYEQEKAKVDKEDSDGEVGSESLEAVHLLGRSFSHQNNEPLQRRIFRQMGKRPDEPFAAFLGRLREQAQFRNFGNADALDEALEDQIIAKGSLDRLRREMLKKDQPLRNIAQLAQSIENVAQFEKATKRGAGEHPVNAIAYKRPKIEAGGSS